MISEFGAVNGFSVLDEVGFPPEVDQVSGVSVQRTDDRSQRSDDHPADVRVRIRQLKLNSLIHHLSSVLCFLSSFH